MAKTTTKVATNVTLEEAQAAGAEYAQYANAHDVALAKMNDEINTIRNKYADEITGNKSALEKPEKILLAYAQENKTAWKGKSFKLAHCTIGFETNPPKVDRIGKFTWPQILDFLKKFKIGRDYVRTTEEIDKKAILALKDEKVLRQLADKAYITITQDEQFYVKTKTDELN